MYSKGILRRLAAASLCTAVLAAAALAAPSGSAADKPEQYPAPAAQWRSPALAPRSPSAGAPTGIARSAETPKTVSRTSARSLPTPRVSERPDRPIVPSIPTRPARPAAPVAAHTEKPRVLAKSTPAPVWSKPVTVHGVTAQRLESRSEETPRATEKRPLAPTIPVEVRSQPAQTNVERKPSTVTVWQASTSRVSQTEKTVRTTEKKPLAPTIPIEVRSQPARIGVEKKPSSVAAWSSISRHESSVKTPAQPAVEKKPSAVAVWQAGARRESSLKAPAQPVVATKVRLPERVTASAAGRRRLPDRQGTVLPLAWHPGPIVRPYHRSWTDTTHQEWPAAHTNLAFYACSFCGLYPCDCLRRWRAGFWWPWRDCGTGWSVGVHGDDWWITLSDWHPRHPRHQRHRHTCDRFCFHHPVVKYEVIYYETVYYPVYEPVYYEPAYVPLPAPGTLDVYDDIDRLIDQLKYGDIEQRRQAAKELGYEDTLRALQPLIYALENDTDSTVRYHAAKSLGKLGMRDGLPALRKAADNDPDEVVRTEAQDAVDRILRR